MQLHRDGWVESAIDRGSEPARTGRPASSYRLSQAGDHLFPKQYDELSISVIDAVAEELGPDAAVRILSRLVDDRVGTVEPTLRGLPLDEKITRLKSWYLEDDPFMSTEETRDGYKLVERNCPFLNTAMRRPMVCSISVNALTRLLGVRVDREEKFQNGDGRCVFRVHAEEPIDPATWQFKLEKEL